MEDFKSSIARMKLSQ